MYQKICNQKLDLEKEFKDQPDLASLIGTTTFFLSKTFCKKRLLQPPHLPAVLLEHDPQKRLTDPAAIKRHLYFASIDWDRLLQKEVTPTYIPPVWRKELRMMEPLPDTG